MLARKIHQSARKLWFHAYYTSAQVKISLGTVCNHFAYSVFRWFRHAVAHFSPAFVAMATHLVKKSPTAHQPAPKIPRTGEIFGLVWPGFRAPASSGITIRALLLGLLLLGSACAPDEGELDAQIVALLERSGETGEQRAMEFSRIYSSAQDPRRVTHAVVAWAAEHPQRFTEMASYLVRDGFAENFAASAAESGKLFLLLERLDSDDAALQELLRAMHRHENRDRRVKVPAYQLAADSAPQRIARLRGTNDSRNWQGGAMLLLESQCQLAFAAAGHTLADEFGRLRAPLDSFELVVAGRSYRVAEAEPQNSPLAPEHDWVVLIADKDECGQTVAPGVLAMPAAIDIPETGLDVELYCYHQGRSDVDAALYREQCRMYPSEAGVLDHYATKKAGLIGVHSCRSEKGSSGCPLLYNQAGALHFLGTQIERDSLTRAGIARLFSGEFRLALAAIETRFAAHDRDYARQHGLLSSP